MVLLCEKASNDAFLLYRGGENQVYKEIFVIFRRCDIILFTKNKSRSQQRTILFIEKCKRISYNKTMSDLIIDLLFVLSALAAIILCSRAMYKVRQLKLKYKAAIILIPLYYTKVWHIMLFVIYVSLIVVAFIFMLTTRLYVIFSSIIVILIMFSALTIKMMTCRFAVLDCGIVTPFRYINWLHLYEYSIKDGKVFFYKDEDGYDTIRAISPRLSFDEANTAKLEFLLNRHKVKSK